MRSHITQQIIFFFILFSIASVYIPGKGPDALIVALLSVATFLFGILGAYILQNRQTRLDNLRITLRQFDALCINIYHMSSIFGKSVQKRAQTLIANYYDSTIDHMAKDFSMSNRQFIELYQYVVDLQNKKMKELNQNPVLLYAFDNIMDTINEANKNRKSIEYMVRDTMLRFEWFILLSLYAVIIVCVFEINDNSITSIGITILVSTVNMALIIIIRSLDEMMWKEEKWTWEPLTQFYEEIDLTPYVPEPCVREGRLILKKGKKYRVAEYPRPYPDMTGKTVKMIVG